MSQVIFIFLDGVGIAPRSDHNPLSVANMPTVHRLLGGALTTELGRVITPRAAMVPIDATLGMPGLPQSGTGQATLMTGENCARIHGSHFGPYPPSLVRPVVNARNLFVQCAARNLPFDFVNAYPQRYFDYLAAHPAMKPTIASSFEIAGRGLHTADDLRAGRAISADIKGARWNELGYEGIVPITPQEAGARLADIATDNAFTMFEYWLTDKAGHKQDVPAACTALDMLDGMLEGMTDTIDERGMLCVITSDHGNMEDCSVGSHTRNPVPLIAIGAGAAAFVHAAESLMDVAPGIMGVLANTPQH